MPDLNNPNDLAVTMNQMRKWAEQGSRRYPGGSIGEALASDFMALDAHLRAGGALPVEWQAAATSASESHGRHAAAPAGPPAM